MFRKLFRGANATEKRRVLIETIGAELTRLDLPAPSRHRLVAIIQVLIAQIKAGYDNPRMTIALLDSACAELRQHGDDPQRQRILQTIMTLQQTETERLLLSKQQSTSAEPLPDRLSGLIEEGHWLVNVSQSPAACNRWLEAWELVKQLATPERQSLAAFDEAYPTLVQPISEWVLDLVAELYNAGLEQVDYHEQCLRFVQECLQQFPEDQAIHVVGLRRAEGEALWALGRRDEAEAVYQALVGQFPEEGWVYIGWADQYWLGTQTPKDYDRGETILRQALARPTLLDRGHVLDRLDMLRDECMDPPARQGPTGK